jgi:CRISPR-associated protein Csx17
VVQHPGEAARWQSVLLALAAVEGVMASGTGFGAGPVPRLRPEWVVAADDASPAFRLALSLALQAAAWIKDRGSVDGIRRHWLPLKGARFNTRTEAGRERLTSDPGVVMAGRDGCADAIALVERRLVEAAQRGHRHLPLKAAPHASARLDDLALAVAGEVDLNRTLALARALMALDGRAWSQKPPALARQPCADAVPDDTWMAIRLALLPWPHRDGLSIGCDPAIVRRLAAGDAASAVDLALRRLRAAGLCPSLRSGVTDPATAFPITQRTAARMLRRLAPSPAKEEFHAAD